MRSANTPTHTLTHKHTLSHTYTYIREARTHNTHTHTQKHTPWVRKDAEHSQERLVRQGSFRVMHRDLGRQSGVPKGY